MRVSRNVRSTASQAVQMATMERETSETKEINYGIEYTK